MKVLPVVAVRAVERMDFPMMFVLEKVCLARSPLHNQYCQHNECMSYVIDRVDLIDRHHHLFGMVRTSLCHQIELLAVVVSMLAMNYRMMAVGFVDHMTIEPIVAVERCSYYLGQFSVAVASNQTVLSNEQVAGLVVESMS
jgi:hypothetical protein